ncbi:MAG: hypothetical protein Q8Q60_01665 [Candidatus Chromulinivorax sp.]|nr:hypothetical protein [Candidatus Chromulinivorax sp.]
MANISTPSILGKQFLAFHDDNQDTKLFTFPFSEHDVLELQEIFVALGVHTIKAKNIVDGRRIITTILQSLNYYHNVGCITEMNQLPVNVCDILNHIILQKSQRGDLLHDLEDFFSIYSYFDFIWIELTHDMKKQYAYEDIKNIFDMYHAEERMPVVIVTYDEE